MGSCIPMLLFFQGKSLTSLSSRSRLYCSAAISLRRAVATSCGISPASSSACNDNDTTVSVHGILLMNRQFVITHTIHQTEIPTLLDSWVANTPSVKMCQQKNCFSLYFRKNITCLIVGLLTIGQVISVSCKTMY
jgi:hypothetical protein